MSGQSLVMFISMIAIAIAANRADDSSSWLQQRHLEQNPGMAVRGPTSVGGKKDIIFAQKDMIKHTHKVRGPLAAIVELIGQPPQQQGDVFVLKGIVSAESNLKNVDFAWRIPEGVEVIQGQTSSVIAVLNGNKPFETQITLRQVSPANARVTLRVHGHDDGMRFGDNAIYHTLDQEKIESARLELKSKTAEYMKQSFPFSGKQIETLSDDKKQLKIFH